VPVGPRDSNHVRNERLRAAFTVSVEKKAALRKAMDKDGKPVHGILRRAGKVRHGMSSRGKWSHCA